MKVYVSAALIATALASPVRGEIVELTCIDLRGEGWEFKFTLNTEDFSLTTNDTHIPVLSVSDDHMSWVTENFLDDRENAHVTSTYLLNRRSLVMTFGLVSLDDYKNFTELDYEFERQFYQCIRPL